MVSGGAQLRLSWYTMRAIEAILLSKKERREKMKEK